MTGDKGTPSAIHAGMGVINPEAHAANVEVVRAKYADSPLLSLIAEALFGEYDNTPALKATRTPTGRARIHSKSHARIGGPL